MPFKRGGGAVGNALPPDVANGVIFSSAAAGVGVPGTLASNGVVTVTPSTIDQALEGIYASGSKVAGVANAVAGNIKLGVNIAGTVGSLQPLRGINTLMSANFPNLSTNKFCVGRWDNGEVLIIDTTINGECKIYNANGTLKATISHPNGTSYKCIGKTPTRIIWVYFNGGAYKISLTTLTGVLVGDYPGLASCNSDVNAAGGHNISLFAVDFNSPSYLNVIDLAGMYLVGSSQAGVSSSITGVCPDNNEGCFTFSGNWQNYGYVTNNNVLASRLPVLTLGYGG